MSATIGGKLRVEFDFVCASFANHFAIAQNGNDFRATTSSPTILQYSLHPIPSTPHSSLIFHSDSVMAMGVNCEGLVQFQVEISARDFSTNFAPDGHKRNSVGDVLGDVTCYKNCTRHNSYFSILHPFK